MEIQFSSFVEICSVYEKSELFSSKNIPLKGRPEGGRMETKKRKPI